MDSTDSRTAELCTQYKRAGDHGSYWVLRALRAGETLEVEGIPVRMVEGDPDLVPGDLYVGARNTANLLTVKSVGNMNCVWPEEPAYPFYTGECIKVALDPRRPDGQETP